MRTLRMGTDALRASPPAQQHAFFVRTYSTQACLHASAPRAIELQLRALAVALLSRLHFSAVCCAARRAQGPHGTTQLQFQLTQHFQGFMRGCSRVSGAPSSAAPAGSAGTGATSAAQTVTACPSPAWHSLTPARPSASSAATWSCTACGPGHSTLHTRACMEEARLLLCTASGRMYGRARVRVL